MRVYKGSSGSDIIEEIEQGITVIVQKMANYTPRYYVKYDGSKFGWISGAGISKPKKETGPTENLRIQSSTLILQGDLETISWNGKTFEVRSFNSADHIISSILKGIFDNTLISQEIKQQVLKICKNINSSIIWDGTIDYHEINELGKYLNELIIGIKMLLDRKIEKFLIPTRSNFPGIDSLFMYNQRYIPISSKYGEGAVPQLYPLISNISSDIFDNRLRNSQLYRLLMSYKSNSSHVLAIYNFALNKILRFGVECEDLYEDARDNIRSKDLVTVENYVLKYCDNMKIIDAFPLSLTSYCARIASHALNNCLLSKEVIRNYLQSINLHQFHLCNESWHKGKIEYNMKKTWECLFSVTYGKSSINSLSADRGLLCYRFGENINN